LVRAIIRSLDLDGIVAGFEANLAAPHQEPV